MDTTERPRPQCTAPQFRISLTNLVDCLGVFSQSLVNESPLILSYRAAGDPLEMRRGRTTSAPPPTHAIGHSPLRAFFVDLEPRFDRACRWTPGQPDPEQCAECQALAGCRRLTIERCAQSRQSTSVRYRHVISALLRPTSHTGYCSNHVRPRHCCNPVAEDATTSAVTYEQTTVSKAIIRSSVLRDALMEVDWSDTTACGRLSLSPLSPHFELSVDYATGLGYKARDIPASHWFDSKLSVPPSKPLFPHCTARSPFRKTRRSSHISTAPARNPIGVLVSCSTPRTPAPACLPALPAIEV